jgi:glycosyltransferase involved in cell wall biosynthesis|tara:strand:+ start:1896 stop:3077 length:1182 start_codon:yes stop_codon:yes gene_type:complete
MNILIIHEVDWVKKVTFEIHHLSELFSLNGHNVFAIDVPDPGKISINNEFKQDIENFHRIYEKSSVKLFRTPIIPIKGLNRISAYFTSYRFIKKILQDYSIDIVLLYSIVTNAKATIKACKEVDVPIINRTFDVIHDLIDEKYLKNIVIKIEKSVYSEFNQIIANTPFMKNWAIEMNGKNVIIIPQGVDSNLMKPLSKDLILQNKIGIESNDKVVMYLGSIHSISGLPIILEYLPDIIKKIPNFKLLVVGGGAHLENLKQISKKLKIEKFVIFTDYVPYLEIPKYCSLANLCINPFEITDMTKKLSPVKIFDLLACGKPILATPLDGLLFDFPKESNILIYSELENFKEKIILLLNDENLNSLGINGRKFVEENYTWENVANRFLKEFEKYLN